MSLLPDHPPLSLGNNSFHSWISTSQKSSAFQRQADLYATRAVTGPPCHPFSLKLFPRFGLTRPRLWWCRPWAPFTKSQHRLQQLFETLQWERSANSSPHFCKNVKFVCWGLRQSSLFNQTPKRIKDKCSTGNVVGICFGRKAMWCTFSFFVPSLVSFEWLGDEWRNIARKRWIHRPLN